MTSKQRQKYTCPFV